MSIVAVTGASGLLGAHFLVQAVQQFDTIIAIYRNDYSKVQPVFEAYGLKDQYSKIEWRKADLTHVADLEEALAGVNRVYHLAASVDFEGNKNLIQYNEQLTASIVNACLHLNIPQLVHISSVAALGRKKEGEVKTEDAIWESSKNNSAYAISKYRAEMEAWRGMVEGLEVLVIAPPIILAPGIWDQSSGQLLPRVAKGLPFYTEGTNGFVDVRDLVRASIQLSQKNEVYGHKFIVCGHNTSYRALFERMARSLGVNPPKIHLTKSLGRLLIPLEWLRSKLMQTTPLLTAETLRSSQGKFAYSSEKLLQSIDFSFTSFDDTIEWIANWYTFENK
jgi:dihydroflavonol-4-reductase